MKVYIVDDDQRFADEIADNARDFGHDVAVHLSPETAWQELQDDQRMDVLVLLDHDFHGVAKGYELCSKIRRSHPLGLLVPIVYLTGRETREGYLDHYAGEPILSPSLYLDKGALTRRTELLPQLLRRFGEQFAQLLELADDQAARRALISFRDAEDVANEDV